MPFPVRVRGTGQAEVAAHGVADAEHLVQKELGRLWPAARAEVVDIHRAGGAGRLVEDFRVSYWLEGVVMTDAATEDEAPRTAFRLASEFLSGSRYQHTEWSLARPR